jgi:hypothetical protein
MSDQDTRDNLFTTYPRWIGSVLREVLPEGEGPLAVYYSWEYGSRKVPAIIVLRNALLGVHLEFVNSPTSSR